MTRTPTTPTTPTTTTDREPTAAAATIPVDRLVVHPDNPRRKIGDLAELVRSVHHHGILQPLLVLPADDSGQHRIVAGHRRHAAAVTVGLREVPCLVRSLTAVEAIEAMLIENIQRSDLTTSEEVDAIARLVTVGEKITVKALAGRLGRSQTWVRDRMTLAVLPGDVRRLLDDGSMSLAVAVAVASLADLGPDHMSGAANELVRRSWPDPTRAVTDYRRTVTQDDEIATLAARLTKRAITFWIGTADRPKTAVSATDLFGYDAAEAHKAYTGESCHGVQLARSPYRTHPEQTAYCLTPTRHTTSGTRPPASTLTTPARTGATGDNGHARRQGRLARLAGARDVFARRRRGPSANELVDLIAAAFIATASHDAATHAATILGHDADVHTSATTLLDTAGAGRDDRIRVIAAIAFATAELHAYHAPASDLVRDAARLLTSHGWDPDQWTLAHTINPDHAADEDDNGGGPDDDGSADDDAGGLDGGSDR